MYKSSLNFRLFFYYFIISLSYFVKKDNNNVLYVLLKLRGINASQLHLSDQWEMCLLIRTRSVVIIMRDCRGSFRINEFHRSPDGRFLHMNK